MFHFYILLFNKRKDNNPDCQGCGVKMRLMLAPMNRVCAFNTAAATPTAWCLMECGAFRLKLGKLEREIGFLSNAEGIKRAQRAH